MREPRYDDMFLPSRGELVVTVSCRAARHPPAPPRGSPTQLDWLTCGVCPWRVAIDVRVDKPITFASHPLGETKHLLMPLWRVLDFDGEPVGAEGQKLAWASADELDSFAMPPADGPLLDPVRLAMSDI